MKRWLRSVSFGLTLLLTGSAYAFDEHGASFVYGQGLSKCSDFLGEFAKSDIKQTNGQTVMRESFVGYFSWFQGFLTGINYGFPGGADVVNMDVTGTVNWVAAWCRDNPTAPLFQGASTFISSRLQQIRQK